MQITKKWSKLCLLRLPVLSPQFLKCIVLLLTNVNQACNIQVLKKKFIEMYNEILAWILKFKDKKLRYDIGLDVSIQKDLPLVTIMYFEECPSVLDDLQRNFVAFLKQISSFLYLNHSVLAHELKICRCKLLMGEVRASPHF